jgi:hypothetical protein
MEPVQLSEGTSVAKVVQRMLTNIAIDYAADLRVKITR